VRAGVILRVQPCRVVGEFMRNRALSRLRRDLDKPEMVTRKPLHGRVWLDSERAVCCAECASLYEPNGALGCPRCGDGSAVPVALALNPGGES